MSCAKVKSAGLAHCALFWRPCFHEETRFGSLPFSILLCLWVDCLLWLSVIFKHEGAHLKRLNANLISYMKQSWFIFPELFFPTLQTSQRTPRIPSTHTPLLAGIMPFNMQSKESVLWTLATAPHPPPTCPFTFSRYLPTAGAEPSPKITVILKKEKYWEPNLDSAHITVIRLILGKLDDTPYYQRLLCLCLWMPISLFCGCLKDLNVVYLSQNLLLYKHCEWINRYSL